MLPRPAVIRKSILQNFFVPLLWACPLIFAVFPELTKPQTDEAAFGCCVGCDNFSSRGSQQKGRALARGTSADSPVRGSPARVTSTGRYGVPTNDMYKIYNKQYGFSSEEYLNLLGENRRGPLTCFLCLLTEAAITVIAQHLSWQRTMLTCSTYVSRDPPIKVHY